MTYLNDFCSHLAAQDKFFILDTETTGLQDGEICQIAIIDNAGKVFFNDFVRTKEPIPADATAIHGITDALVQDAKTWSEIAEPIGRLLSGETLVVYNAVYDRKMMHKSAERHGMEKIEWKELATWYCAMEAFSEYYGEWNDYHQSYRWKTLSFAARHCNSAVINAHTALGDCLMTLAVVEYMLDNYNK